MSGSATAANNGPRFKGSGPRPNDYNEPLALRSVGNGHRRATAYRPSSEEAIIGCHRLEAEAFASINDKDVVQFVWKNIVCRFGIPQSIVTNNGPQFNSRVYMNFYSELKTKKTCTQPPGTHKAMSRHKILIRLSYQL